MDDERVLDYLGDMEGRLVDRIRDMQHGVLREVARLLGEEKLGQSAIGPVRSGEIGRAVLNDRMRALDDRVAAIEEKLKQIEKHLAGGALRQ
jgi:hypothetical protein